MTVSQLITAALQDLRVLQVGETASANDAAYGLDRLNDWIDGLATEGLSVYSRARTIWTISSATTYTIGAGATINCARPTGPMAIDNVGFQDTSVSPTCNTRKSCRAAVMSSLTVITLDTAHSSMWPWYSCYSPECM